MTDTQTTTPESRIFHTLLTFRCPSTLSEQLEAYGARIGIKSISHVIRILLEQGLKANAA